MKQLTFVLAVWAASLGVRAESEGPVRDDPRGRQAARAIDEGARTPEDRFNILQIARAEARKMQPTASGPAPAARVPGSAWVNLGPRTANFEKNGVTYFKVDSGRPRTILV